MRWCTNKDQSDYMATRKRQNVARSRTNQNENLAAAYLRQNSRLKWERQKKWGCRIFDFWCGHKGVAIEIDGSSHDPEYDVVRDRYNLLRSAIVVLRVTNGDIASLAQAVTKAETLPSWKQRRSTAGLNIKGPGSKALRRSALADAGVPLAHGKWSPPTMPRVQLPNWLKRPDEVEMTEERRAAYEGAKRIAKGQDIAS